MAIWSFHTIVLHIGSFFFMKRVSILALRLLMYMSGWPLSVCIYWNALELIYLMENREKYDRFSYSYLDLLLKIYTFILQWKLVWILRKPWKRFFNLTIIHMNLFDTCCINLKHINFLCKYYIWLPILSHYNLTTKLWKNFPLSHIIAKKIHVSLSDLSLQ